MFPMVQFSAAADWELPADLVIVTTCPETVVANDPSIVEHVPLVLTTEVRMNPAPKVTLIFPVAGMAFTVVNEIVVVLVAPATRDAGSTLVPLSVPTEGRMVSAATALSWSIMSSELLVVWIT